MLENNSNLVTQSVNMGTNIGCSLEYVFLNMNFAKRRGKSLMLDMVVTSRDF